MCPELTPKQRILGEELLLEVCKNVILEGIPGNRINQKARCEQTPVLHSGTRIFSKSWQ